jgi:hypothetical protein
MLNGSSSFALTTFNNRLDELGGLCLELLDKQLKNEPVKNHKISIKPELIIKESCAKNKPHNTKGVLLKTGRLKPKPITSLDRTD